MSEERVKLSGKIVHVFAHRFVVQTTKGAVLADLTPHGAEAVRLRIGADVELEGEQNLPSSRSPASPAAATA